MLLMTNSKYFHDWVWLFCEIVARASRLLQDNLMEIRRHIPAFQSDFELRKQNKNHDEENDDVVDQKNVPTNGHNFGRWIEDLIKLSCLVLFDVSIVLHKSSAAVSQYQRKSHA